MLTKSEYRPRLRVNRKKPVTRKGCYVMAVCESQDDAEAVAAFLESMFEAAKRDKERAVAILNQQKADAQMAALLMIPPEKYAEAAPDGLPTVMVHKARQTGMSASMTPEEMRAIEAEPGEDE